MTFKEIPYERIEVVEAAKKMRGLTEELRAAKTAADAQAAVDGLMAELDRAATMSSLCYIRHTIDTNDKFYNAEQEYYDENTPLIEECENEFMRELLKSPHRPELEKELGSLMFKNAEISLKTFSPEIIPELQEENRLTTEYKKLIASAQIEFDGKKRTLPELAAYKENADRNVRKAAWEAEGGFLNENGQKLDEIYDKLVKLRTKIAQKLGYENFVELGYYRMMRNCYDKNDVQRFRAAVKKSLVPLSARLKAEQAARLGAAEMSLVDNSLMFKSGNAKPTGATEQILETCREMYRELSPETGEFIDVLYGDGMLDVTTRPGKAGGGYCTELADYKRPFIFANFNGTADDVNTMTHEAGHAFAFYLARDMFRPYREGTYETCEVHSMSMEFLTWPWAEKFFGEKTLKFKYDHLAGAINFIPYGTLVDAFQHAVYENPGMSPDERRRAWLELEREFRPYLKLEGVPAYEDGRGWQRQSHIYEMPFYYIDYCLAQTAALQFWARSLEDRGQAWEDYLAFVKRAGTDTFTGLIDSARLNSPFDEDALAGVAAIATRWLDGMDANTLD